MKTKIILVILVLGGLAAGLYWLQPGAGNPSKPDSVPKAVLKTVKTGMPVEMVKSAVTTPASAAPAPAGTKLNLAEVPETVRGILDTAGDAWQRQQAVRALSAGLTAAELAPVMEFLRERHAEDETQVGHVLKNDLMDALVAQQTPQASLAELFTGIYQNPDQNTVIRDYAIQHLSTLSERLGESPAGWGTDQVAAQRRQIRDALWEAAADSQSSIAGTALIGLTRLSESDADVDRGRLGQSALKLAGSEATQSAARITALQVCARLQVTQALPLLAQVAENGTDVPLRLSAIGALGLMGGRVEAGLLRRISEAGDERLAPVAAVALRRIQEREGRL